MRSKDTVEGVVTETLGGGRYRVEIPEKGEIIAYVAGRMKQNGIRVGLRDKVEVVLDPAGGHATNRIVWRR